MDAKKIIFTGILLLIAMPCWAGQTTISGTMSCYMPEHVEIRPKAQPSIDAASTPRPPEVSGASGLYAVSSEERQVPQETMLTDKTEITRTDAQDETVLIYSVCAK